MPIIISISFILCLKLFIFIFSWFPASWSDMSDHNFFSCLQALESILSNSYFKISCSSLFVSHTASKQKQTKFGSRSANRTFERSKLTRIASDCRIQIVYDMAQPANKRTPLEKGASWDKPTPDPLLGWEKWRVQYKFALLAKENIFPDTLLGPKPEMLDLPLKPIYEETIMGSSAQSEKKEMPATVSKKWIGKTSVNN